MACPNVKRGDAGGKGPPEMKVTRGEFVNLNKSHLKKNPTEKKSKPFRFKTFLKK